MPAGDRHRDLVTDRYAAMLTHHGGRPGADMWLTYGRCLKGMLFIKRDPLDVGVAVLRDAAAELSAVRFVQYAAFLAALAEGLAGAGAVRSLAVLDETAAQSDTGGERWIIAELIRLKASSSCCRTCRTPTRSPRITPSSRLSGRPSG